MSEPSKPQKYREMIDELVHVCRHGQGQIGARRVRAGLWNANARSDYLEEQHAVNLLAVVKHLSGENAGRPAGVSGVRHAGFR